MSRLEVFDVRLDLHPQPAMAPTIGLLFASVEDTYQRLIRMVGDMSPAQLEYRGPDGTLNSTAQLLQHLIVVHLYWVWRLRGQEFPPPDLQARFGPMFAADNRLPHIQGVPLDRLLADHAEVHEQLRQSCLTLTDADLDKEIPYEFGDTATVRWGIWHIGEHSRHHQGQIAWLKKWARM